MAMKLDPYLPLPTDDLKVLQALHKATRHNMRLDAIDEKNGQPPLRKRSLTEQLRTAISAIVCGISIEGWDEVAQGLQMLMTAEVAIRQLEKEIEIAWK